jgi:multidrug efflux pump
LTRGDLSAKEKDKLVKNTEENISGLDGILMKYAKTGADGRTKDLVGAVRTIFTDWSEREKASILMEKMRSRVKYLEGADINIVAQKEGPGGQGKPVRIEITGSDFVDLNKALKKIKLSMERIEGFIDISDNAPSPGLEWTLKIDREAAARHGVTVASLGTMVKLLTRGVKVSDYRPDDTDSELEVFLRYVKSERNLDRLQELRVPTSDGRYVPLSVFAQLKPVKKGGTIQRLDGSRLRLIEANVKDGFLAPALIENLKKKLSAESFPNNIEINFAGEDEDIKETQAFLGQSLIFSLVLMSIVLMIQFNSAWQTTVTMSAIILSTGGIFLLLLLTERPFGVVMSMLGLIALAGIVVNNNIVLIDTFNEFRKKGYKVKQAAYLAGLTRFRPVILTAVTTILGLVPMVFGITIRFSERDFLIGAPSSQWWVDLSSTIAGGLTFATFLTLMATPALLVCGDRFSNISFVGLYKNLLKNRFITLKEN